MYQEYLYFCALNDDFWIHLCIAVRERCESTSALPFSGTFCPVLTMQCTAVWTVPRKEPPPLRVWPSKNSVVMHPKGLNRRLMNDVPVRLCVKSPRKALKEPHFCDFLFQHFLQAFSRTFATHQDSNCTHGGGKCWPRQRICSGWSREISTDFWITERGSVIDYREKPGFNSTSRPASRSRPRQGSRPRSRVYNLFNGTQATVTRSVHMLVLVVLKSRHKLNIGLKAGMWQKCERI